MCRVSLCVCLVLCVVVVAIVRHVVGVGGWVGGRHQYQCCVWVCVGVGNHVCRHGYVSCGCRVSGRRVCVLQSSCPCVCVCVQCVSGEW